MGNFTVTNNWTSNSSTNVTNGDRGNVVNGNATVTNGNWPSGAQAVMATAGRPERGSGRQTTAAARRRPVRPLRSTCRTPAPTNGTQVQFWDCSSGANQRWTYTSEQAAEVYGNKCLDANGQGTSQRHRR